MPSLRFSKYHGLGNDFILVDARHDPVFVSPAAAARLCDRRRGIGADGVLTLLPSRDSRAELRMHIFNADGSVAEMCGNGLRCVVRFVLTRTAAGHLAVDTDGGLREGWLEPDGRVRVTLGTARMIEPEIEANSDGETRRGIGISMGNPHLVLRPVEGDPVADARRLGPVFERHPRFEHRTNVGFLQVTEPRAIRLVVFERGSGLTEACGTGAGAAAVATTRWGLVPSNAPIRVDLPGGPLAVRVIGDASAARDFGDELGEVEITGEAVHVFDGTVDVPASEVRDPRDHRL